MNLGTLLGTLLFAGWAQAGVAADVARAAGLGLVSYLVVMLTLVAMTCFTFWIAPPRPRLDWTLLRIGLVGWLFFSLMAWFAPPAHAAEPSCEIVVANDRPSTVEILWHEIAHCNGWSHPTAGHGKPGYSPPKPPAEFLHDYEGQLTIRWRSSEDARRLCDRLIGFKSLGCAKRRPE